MSDRGLPSIDWIVDARSLYERLRAVSPDRQLAFIRSEIEKLPPEHRELVSHYVTAVVIAASQGAVTPSGSTNNRNQMTLIACVAVLFLVAVIVFIYYKSQPLLYDEPTHGNGAINGFPRP